MKARKQESKNIRTYGNLEAQNHGFINKISTEAERHESQEIKRPASKEAKRPRSKESERPGSKEAEGPVSKEAGSKVIGQKSEETKTV